MPKVVPMELIVNPDGTQEWITLEEANFLRGHGSRKDWKILHDSKKK